MTTLGALLGSCAILTAQPDAKLSGKADPEPSPAQVGRYDADGDGMLSEAERKAMTTEQKTVAEARAEWANAKYDTDKDGELSDSEKEAMRQDMAEQAKMQREAWIKKFDKDGDGELSAAETEAMQAYYGTERKKLLEKYDMNNNGMLDRDEIETANTMGDLPGPLYDTAKDHIHPGSKARDHGE